MKILVLEPYYGGSHKAFLDNLCKRLPFDFHFMTLPARKWKWRMRLSAPYFAEKMRNHKAYDRILCSSFVDVATLKALAPKWASSVPILTYFHENQFAYPVQVQDERDFHFGLTNVTTALASDALAFNSQYNLDTFLQGAKQITANNLDFDLADFTDKIRKKATVLYPGANFDAIDAIMEETPPSRTPVLLWNHRWEHDKNPDLFFESLYRLSAEKVDFKLVVAGQSFQRKPPVFGEAEQKLSKHILHFGFIPSHKEYIQWLKKCDIVISTATHEFFGISVIEAVRSGCRPILPSALSYPELFPAEFLYGENDFYHAIYRGLTLPRLSLKQAKLLTDQFSWHHLASKYKKWLEC